MFLVQILSAAGGIGSIMIIASIIRTQPRLNLPFDLPNNLSVLLISGVCAFLLAYLFTFGVIVVCRKLGWLDRPAARRVHTNAVPRLGGVAIFLAFVVVSLLFYTTDPELQSKEIIIYWLFLVAASLIVLVHAYDDIKGLKPLSKFIAQTIAVLIILGPFGSQFRGVLLFGLNNPLELPHLAIPGIVNQSLHCSFTIPLLPWRLYLLCSLPGSG